ncbi:MAG: zinc-dependent metalloprotease family protein [Pyrinomonadaceae bacterium]
MFKKNQSILLFIITMLVISTSVMAGRRSNDKIWQEIDDANLKQRGGERFVSPLVYKTFRLNKRALQPILDKAPLEFLTVGQNSDVILTIPMPDGSFGRFAVKESPIMEPALAATFPEIKTYVGQGIDDPTATTRFDMTPVGFRAIILSKDGTVYIEPYSKGDTSNYISFNKENLGKPATPFACLVGAKGAPVDLTSSDYKRYIDTPDLVTNGTMLRTYRLALAATGEYTAAVGGGTVGGAMAAMTTTMNRVNAIYEREVSVRMVIVANNNAIIYTNGATDPYTNDSGDMMLNENQTNIDNVIGTANYDIGHVFSTGGGGIASLNSPCDAAQKAQGVTGSPNPQGDPFDVDYVAHEMGHQFGGAHTFNSNTGSCMGNRDQTAAYETASGSTIQAYAGICTPQDLQQNSNDYFHVKSLEQIVTFITGGGGCSVNTATGNTPPTVGVSGGTTFNIPRNTPFTLTATGSDPNGDNLTYDWEQYDLGPEGLPNANNLGPLFRSYSPTASPSRTFPSLAYILNNANAAPPTFMGTSATGSVCRTGDTCISAEFLPATARTMNFQVTARDNRMGGGGINSTTATVVVDGGSGPFSITAPNTGVSWQGGSQQTVSWNVNNTNNAPVSAANVKISLSTDGGQSFPTVLLASTPNDGSQSITIPNTPTSQARIKVEAVGNIFFDISDANFTITPGVGVNRRPVFDYDGDDKTDISIFRPGPGEWWYLRSGNGGNNAFQFGSGTDKLVPADFTGDDKTDIAFWRESTGEWFVLRSEDSSFYSFPFGTTNDIPVPADYDGDGKADPAIFRPSSATWFIIRSTDGGTTIAQFGANTDLPVPADYDGDGKADLAIFRPGDGSWWLNRSTSGLIVYNFGTGTDRTVPGDYTGDGKADVAFWRPTTGEWFILRSEDASFYSGPFGAMGDVPVPGDYDGDGKYDTAVFRPSNSTWFKQGSTSGFEAVTFGIAGDLPTPNAFVR